MAAASFLARDGWKVTVLEKNATPGGRARQWISDGFTFDMGPSFYWMPDVFERYFGQFGKKLGDYYGLERLDPSYRIYWNDRFLDFSADYAQLKQVFESLEKGSGRQLDRFLQQAEKKYRIGMGEMVYKPGLSIREFLNWKTFSGALQLDIFRSIRSHIKKHFRHPQLRQAMEFPVLFLGALPQNTPSLYSLMNYADIRGGTWYPEGGMYSVVRGMHRLATELGVEFHFNENVTQILYAGGKARGGKTADREYRADVVISGADYHFTETALLDKDVRNYSEKYWDKKLMAPSCLMFYVGLNRKLKQLVHHSLFFDVPFEKHGEEIYENPAWPGEPLFYVSVSSKTDDNAAPPGCENLVILIPVAAGLQGDDEDLREKYFNIVINRMEKLTGENIRDSVILKRAYSVSDFAADYNAYRGNAYGLANTLRQTAILRPSCRNRKLDNLYYTGQLTVPGPGVPPSLISGEIVALQVSNDHKH